MTGKIRILLLLLLLAARASSADEPIDRALAEYVFTADASYGWVKQREGEFSTSSYVELILTSQTWRETVWKHQLFIIRPSNCRADEKHALLFITGGSWTDDFEGHRKGDELPREAALFASLAQQLKTPVAVLLQVPHQPLFDGKYEDAIIAYTFDKFLESGDPTWPLLLPMVKSAVRGMDAVQEYSNRHWSLDIRTFTVTGASKRGWTTWLSGAVDKRVVAIAPMVIDVLNMSPQMQHQRQVWGKFSRQIDDYTERGLQEKMDTQRGRNLTRIVDPYGYRQTLTQPKLIMIGTNDPYWPIDALNLYWDDLVGEKYILYVPNNGHSLNDLGRVIGSLNALHQQARGHGVLPKLTWHFSTTLEADTGRDAAATLNMRSDVRPTKVQIWSASSPNRDFRQARWQAVTVQPDNDGSFSYTHAAPESGYTAFFGEAIYDPFELPCYLSTNVKLLLAAEPSR